MRSGKSLLLLATLATLGNHHLGINSIETFIWALAWSSQQVWSSQSVWSWCKRQNGLLTRRGWWLGAEGGVAWLINLFNPASAFRSQPHRHHHNLYSHLRHHHHLDCHRHLHYQYLKVAPLQRCWQWTQPVPPSAQEQLRREPSLKIVQDEKSPVWKAQLKIIVQILLHPT